MCQLINWRRLQTISTVWNHLKYFEAYVEVFQNYLCTVQLIQKFKPMYHQGRLTIVLVFKRSLFRLYEREMHCLKVKVAGLYFFEDDIRKGNFVISLVVTFSRSTWYRFLSRQTFSLAVLRKNIFEEIPFTNSITLQVLTDSSYRVRFCKENTGSVLSFMSKTKKYSKIFEQKIINN